MGRPKTGPDAAMLRRRAYADPEKIERPDRVRRERLARKLLRVNRELDGPVPPVVEDTGLRVAVKIDARIELYVVLDGPEGIDAELNRLRSRVLAVEKQLDAIVAPHLAVAILVDNRQPAQIVFISDHRNIYPARPVPR